MSRNNDTTIFDGLMLFVVCVSACSMILFSLGRFQPLLATILGAIASLIFFRAFNLKLIRDTRFGVGIFLIILIALFFRAKPYLNIIGGDDAGLYVTMSSYYAEKGSPVIIDEVREQLSDEQKEFYDRKNQYQRYLKKPGEYEGKHLPLVYLKDLSESEYVFQFYPLHPLWMAIFGKFLGADNRVYSLVFFSLVSLTGLYLIALEMSEDNKLAAYLVAFFLAINPAHAYFSKYPVADVLLLAFSSTSLYFLIKYYKDSSKDEIHPHYLFLSAGLITCLFFTKISGFMFIPFYYAMMIISLLYVQKRIVRNHLICYFLAIFIMYGISVLYGTTFSFPYSYFIYRKSFPKILGQDWETTLVIFSIIAVMFALGLALIRNRIPQSILVKGTALFRNNLSRILYIVIILGIYTTYQLAFTNKYVGRSNRIPWVPLLGWESVQYSSILAVISYMSPFAFILFLFSISHYRNRRNIMINSLLLFLIPFWMYGTVMRWQVPYQYYWTRYLMSEVVPYSILLVCLYLGHLYQKRLVPKFVTHLFVALISVYPLYFTTLYFINETARDVGANSSLKKIAEYLDEKDLLLIYKEKDFGIGLGRYRHGRIETPLSYYYHLNVMNIEGTDALQDTTLADIIFDSDYKDVFILSRNRLTEDFLIPVDDLLYKFGRSMASETFPPTGLTYLTTDLFLQKIDKSLMLEDLFEKNKILHLRHCKDHMVDFDRISYLSEDATVREKRKLKASTDSKNIFVNIIEENTYWTAGNSSIESIKYRVRSGDKLLILNTAGLTSLDDKELNLRLYVNDEELEFSHKKGTSFYFHLAGIDEIDGIRITSSTFAAVRKDINGSTRELGVNIQSISIE